MLARRAARQSDQTAACIHIPVRCTEASERRNEINAAGILHLARIVFRIPAFREKPHLIAQPLNNRAADKYAALKRILRFVSNTNTDRCQQAVFTFTGCRSGIHQQEAAGAVGVFGVAGIKAGLSEQCCLLIACNAGNRDLTIRQRNIAVNLA